MNIHLIAAVSRDGYIGKDGQLPWHLPADMAHFRAHTLGRTVVMGRRTYESIGKPLPHRTNIVLSRDRNYAPHPDVRVLSSSRRALMYAETMDVDDLYIIGGETVYRSFLPLATHIHVTKVHTDVQGDARFVPFGPLGWKLTEEKYHPADDKNAHDLHFRSWQRTYQ